nr:MAG TPA: hypothetical protein [Caudoviricetes sp.]
MRWHPLSCKIAPGSSSNITASSLLCQRFGKFFRFTVNYP